MTTAFPTGVSATGRVGQALSWGMVVPGSVITWLSAPPIGVRDIRSDLEAILNATVGASGAANTFGTSTSTGGTALTVDTTSAQDVVIALQLANAADTITLESLIINAVHMS